MRMMTQLVPVKDIAISDSQVTVDFIKAIKELDGFARIPTLKAVKFENGRTKYEVLQGAEEVEAARQLGSEWESIQAVTIGDFVRSTGSGFQYLTKAERKQEIEAAQRLLNLAVTVPTPTPKPILTVVAPVPVKKIEPTPDDVEVVIETIKQVAKSSGTARIHTIRDATNLDESCFNSALAKARAENRIDVHLGDPSRMSREEVKKSYVDQHNHRYIGVSIREEVVETKVSQAEVPTTKSGKVNAIIAQYRANPMQFNKLERANIEKLIKMYT